MPKTHNLDAQLLELSFGKLWAIPLGERGRNRTYTIVPCPHPVGDLVELGQTRSGKPRLNNSNDARGWISRVNTKGTYTRGTHGWASVFTPHAKKVRVVAWGEGREGAAGYVGGWDDFIILVETPAVVRVQLEGGYKKPPFYLIYEEGKVTRVREDEVDAFLELNPEFEDFSPEWINEEQLRYNSIPVNYTPLLRERWGYSYPFAEEGDEYDDVVPTHPID